MAERISSDLIERIRERLKVDFRRTGDGNWLRMPQEWRHRQAPAFPMSILWKKINDAAAADEMAKELKPIEPLDEKAVARVEKSLGRKLPLQLRQLYLEIGDGGFGPFSGLRRLSNWAKDYSKLRADTPKERGRDWPEGLLPIVYMNGKRICVDAASGAVVLWTKPPKKVSEKKWLASFIPQSPSVGEWLERWVDTPTQAEDGPDRVHQIEDEHGQDDRREAPGQGRPDVEGEERRPWRGRAGQTLRRWLRMEEDEFYDTFYIASVTRC